MPRFTHLLLALGLLGALAGCHSKSTPPPVTAQQASAQQGQAIDAPASGQPRPTVPGQRVAPADPAERAQLAMEAPEPVVKEGFAPVTFSQLSHFVYETDMDGRLTPESSLPEEVQKLDQTKVAVSGFLMPIEFKEDKVSSLILVRNQLLCCFGEEPKLNEWVFVNVDPPVEAVMDVPVTLFGTLYASPDREENQVVSLYRMQAESMETIE